MVRYGTRAFPMVCTSRVCEKMRFQRAAMVWLTNSLFWRIASAAGVPVFSIANLPTSDRMCRLVRNKSRDCDFEPVMARFVSIGAKDGLHIMAFES